MDALGERFLKGSKFGRDNWKQGGPEFFRETLNHAIYHLMDYANGNTSKESLKQNIGAALWNCMALCWWERTGKKQWSERKQ